MKRIRYFIFISLSLILLFPCYVVADIGLSVKPISPSGAKVTGNQWLFVIQAYQQRVLELPGN